MPAPVLQRCPNCAAACDVSIYVAGQRIRCARCGLHFQARPLVAGADRAGSEATFVEQSAPEADRGKVGVGAVTAMPPEIATAHTLVTSPPRIPGYETLEVLGRGGMGTVFKCRQLSLGRIVAVKVLAPAFADDPAFVARFEKESAALAALNHPHIVSIIDRGKEGPLSYFAMELVAGGSVRQLLQNGPLPPEKALPLFMRVCGAVAAAHEKGVVHRDLKPENILLTEDGSPKVADFGLAGVRDAPGLTQPAMAMGTAQYMAPEQGRDARSVDGRADIYSLGVMLYEMLVGELPTGRFLPPSKRRPGLDPRLDPIVLGMLEADPERRTGDLRAVLHALARLVPRGGSAPPPTADPRARDPARRSRRSGLWSSDSPLRLAVLGALALLAIVVVVYLAGRAPPPRTFEVGLRSLGGAGGAVSRWALDFTRGDAPRVVVRAAGAGWEVARAALERRPRVDEGADARAYLDEPVLPFAAASAEVDVVIEDIDGEAHAELVLFRSADRYVALRAEIGDAPGWRLAWAGKDSAGRAFEGSVRAPETVPPPEVGVKLRMVLAAQGANVLAAAGGRAFGEAPVPGAADERAVVGFGCARARCRFELVQIAGRPGLDRPRSQR